MTPRPIEYLLEDLDEYTSFTKYALVDEAVARQEEITPHLLAILERILADPEAWLDEEHESHSYALVLLTHFGETRAHRLIVNLFSLPEPLPDHLFSDMIGETLPAALIKTGGGSLDGIRELILNRQASDFCRWSACTALGYAVMAGLIHREEAMVFLCSLLTGEEAEPKSNFWMGVVDTLMALHPAEVLDEIERAFDAGLFDETFADMEYIRNKASRDQDEVLVKLRAEYERYTPTDIHDYMRWWDEPGKREETSDRSNLKAEMKRELTQKEKRRKKSRQAKKSRRRNR